jgi:serine/threonine protein kinase
LIPIHRPTTNLIFIKANVMIDENGHARLADFGLLTFVSDLTNPTNSSSATNAGTTRWMSPELLHPEQFGFKQSQPTKKSDCYALGMVILEVLSEEPPFARDKDFIVMRKVIEGERPERPEGAGFTDGLWRMLEQCWLPSPKNRPTVEAVLESLGQVSDWQPPTPSAEDVETDGDESVSTVNQGSPEKSQEPQLARAW